jgi:hypothetical protein
MESHNIKWAPIKQGNNLVGAAEAKRRQLLLGNVLLHCSTTNIHAGVRCPNKIHPCIDPRRDPCFDWPSANIEPGSVYGYT